MNPNNKDLLAKKSELQSKINYFFSTEFRSRSPVSAFLDDISPYCDICVFGGMLRDIYLFGNRPFESDIDIVINNVSSKKEIFSILSFNQSIKNKFGGHRIRVQGWDIDIWELKDTWAFKNGAYNEGAFSSLLKTSFFNWDAIVYDFKEKKIICNNSYFSELDSRYLNINFESNPNSLGVLKRIHKFLNKYEANLSSQIIDYYIYHFPRALLELEGNNADQIEVENLKSLFNHLNRYKNESISSYVAQDSFF